MITPRRLLFTASLWLIWTIGLSPPPPLTAAAEGMAADFTTVASRQAALDELLARRPQIEAAGNAVVLAQLDNEIVRLYLKFWDTDSALREIQSSLQAAEQLAGSANASILVDTLVLSGRLHIRRNEIPAAVNDLERALKLSRDLQYRDGEASALSQRAAAHQEADERDDAIKLNNEALAIWRDLPNKPGEAETLTRQGEVYMMNDDANEATALLRQAEVICRSLDDKPCVAQALTDLGFQAIRQGQWQTALSFFNQVENLNIENDAEPYLAGMMSMGFGLVYEAYSQLAPARSYLEDALKYYRDGAHDKRGTADARSKLARMFAASGYYAVAHEYAEQALAAAMETGNNLNIGLCHEDLGRVWLESGNDDEARAEFLSAIEYFTKSKSWRPLARAQIYLGSTEQVLGNVKAAATAYRAALRHFEADPDYTNEAVVCFRLGKLALENGRLDEAEKNLKRAIDLTEQMRAYASSKDLRSSFLASVHDRYQAYVELLMTRNMKEHDHKLEVQAFEANESGRARAFIDSLHVLRELRQPSDPALLPLEEKLLKHEQQLIDTQAKLISDNGSQQQQAEVARELTQVHSSIEALEARINNNSRFDYLLASGPLHLEEIRNALIDSETSLLSYSLGEQKSFAWLVTKDGLKSFELPNKETIEKAAKPLLDSLKLATDEPSEQERLQSLIDDLSRLVVQPIAGQLTTSRLVIVADGVLQYIPFQILKISPAAAEPLIAKIDVVNEPSASALVLIRRQRQTSPPPGKLLIGFGDAVFSPDYTPAGTSNTNFNSVAQTRSVNVSQLSLLPRLFNAEHEFRAITAVAGDESPIFREYNATRENLLHVDLTQFQVLHVLTHGVFDAQRPELSGLVFSLIDANKQPIPGFVSLADIYRLRAPELVVLSACETAVGEYQAGEGLEGVTRGFMYAGASGVVASLWKVDDDSTAELMKYFYTNLLQGGMGPAAALRDAQNKIRAIPKWRAPYYWAGFTFQGNYDLAIHTVPTTGVRSYQRLIAGAPVIILFVALFFWWYSKRQSRLTS